VRVCLSGICRPAGLVALLPLRFTRPAPAARRPAAGGPLLTAAAAGSRRMLVALEWPEYWDSASVSTVGLGLPFTPRVKTRKKINRCH
jgi:hypothetical protein